MPKQNGTAGQEILRTMRIQTLLNATGDSVVESYVAIAKQEAQAAAGLSSPYIVGVYDWGKDGDTYYIVMEYLRGTDLKSGIKSHGALDPKKVAQIGSQISSALSVAHKHEIIHRDIKPQNIMVLPDGNIKVMDFGIARISRAENQLLSGKTMGSVHYISPEQAKGDETDCTSDIYSVGVMMYEMLSGQLQPVIDYAAAHHYRFCPEQGAFLYCLNGGEEALQLVFCFQVRVEPENG